MSVHAMVSGLIARFGSTQQRSLYLPRMAKGETLGAFALTEPKAGSDASSLTTEARRDGDSFILKGSKCYITSAGFADLYLVFARTSDQEGSGISSFLVPANTPGMTIGKAERKMGCELSPIASLYFDDARIPKEALLGPLHVIQSGAFWFGRRTGKHCCVRKRTFQGSIRPCTKIPERTGPIWKATIRLPMSTIYACRYVLQNGSIRTARS